MRAFALSLEKPFTTFYKISAEHSERQESEGNLEEQIQQQQEEEERIRFTSTPLRMTRAASALKGKTTSFAVTLPFFGTSPEPSELTEDSSWFRGNNRDSPSSLNNQVRLMNFDSCYP